MSSPVGTSASNRPRWFLAGLATSQLLVALDFSIVYVALPTIEQSLRFTPVTLQWVVSAYGIFFAGFLLLGGRLVDVLGAGRVFIFAHLLFSGAALAAGFAPDATTLTVFRALQGVGAALLSPATLALLHARYESGRERDRALAVWGTTGAMGLALGVVAGGSLLAVTSWNWIFWLNLPISLGCLAATGLTLSDGGTRRRRRVNAPAAALVTIVVCTLIGALTEAATPSPNWPLTASALTVAAVLGVAVLLAQRRAVDPLIPLLALRSPNLRAACVIAALYMASMGAEFYLVTLFLQNQLGLSTLQAGVGFLPLALTIAAGNALAGRIAGHWPLRRLLGVAFAVGAVGLVTLAVGASWSGYWSAVLPGLVISGIGQGMAFTGTFITGTRDLAAEAEGAGSAVITAAQYTGGAIGLAVLVWVHGVHPTAATIARAYWVTAVLAFAALPALALMLGPAATSASTSKRVSA